MVYFHLSSPPHIPQSSSEGMGMAIPPAPGAAGGCFCWVIFPEHMDPLDGSNGKFTIYGIHRKSAPEEVTCRLQITGHSL